MFELTQNSVHMEWYMNMVTKKNYYHLSLFFFVTEIQMK